MIATAAITAPHIIGVRHHSPACARLVAHRIRTLRPAFVLIEGPADFNDRIGELMLPHRLPVAIYSHLSTREQHHGSWSPLAEHSPEWQALQVGHATGAIVRFIDLPAWHRACIGLENRYADSPDAEAERQAEAYEAALIRRLNVSDADALWDQLFEDIDGPAPDPAALDALGEALHAHFEQLRLDDPGSESNRTRETMMAQWIAWAMAQQTGPVLVVCGGYHAPALSQRWPDMPTTLPDVPRPEETVEPGEEPPRFGSYLVPYTFRRLASLTGYASGMPSPAYCQWLWDGGPAGAAEQTLRGIMQRLRTRKLPASTADLMSVHARAHGLARLRGHGHPLRVDWLDALVGALVKDALAAPLPWTYRGTLRPGTDPVLVEAMDVLSGDAVGQLAPDTPQPPLVHAVQAELAALGLTLEGQRELDLLVEADRRRSQLLHRLVILQIPGVDRVRGPALALSGDTREFWQFPAGRHRQIEQQAALIEAGAWGATLADAARAKLESGLLTKRDDIEALAAALNQAAMAGLHGVSDACLQALREGVGAASRFEPVAGALGVLHSLLRHGELLGMAGAPVLATVIDAATDRALWLFELPGSVAPAEAEAHLRGMRALREVVADVEADERAGTPPCVAVSPQRARAVWQRKAADGVAAPISRGAALGALLSLGDEAGSLTGAALALLDSLPVQALGDALSGLVALAREVIMHDGTFITGLDSAVRALDDTDFIIALPAMRGALGWLPTQERAALADQVLALHDASHLPRRALTARLTAADASEIAEARALERAALAMLAGWGLRFDGESP